MSSNQVTNSDPSLIAQQTRSTTNTATLAYNQLISLYAQVQSDPSSVSQQELSLLASTVGNATAGLQQVINSLSAQVQAGGASPALQQAYQQANDLLNNLTNQVGKLNNAFYASGSPLRLSGSPTQGYSATTVSLPSDGGGGSAGTSTGSLLSQGIGDNTPGSGISINTAAVQALQGTPLGNVLSDVVKGLVGQVQSGELNPLTGSSSTGWNQNLYSENLARDTESGGVAPNPLLQAFFSFLTKYLQDQGQSGSSNTQGKGKTKAKGASSGGNGSNAAQGSGGPSGTQGTQQGSGGSNAGSGGSNGNGSNAGNSAAGSNAGNSAAGSNAGNSTAGNSAAGNNAGGGGSTTNVPTNSNQTQVSGGVNNNTGTSNIPTGTTGTSNGPASGGVGNDTINSPTAISPTPDDLTNGLNTAGLGEGSGVDNSGTLGNPLLGAANINGFILAVLLESYNAGQKDLLTEATDLQALNRAKDAVRAQLASARAANSTAQDPGGGNSQQVQDLEDQLTSMGDDAQLEQLNLQNLAQNQQQLLQMISNFMKNTHDDSMAIIRHIGGG